MTASEAFEFFQKNVVPEAMAVGRSIIANGPELDVAGILSNLDDRALKDGLKKDPNDTGVRTVLRGMDLITFDNSDSHRASASHLIQQLEGEARRALSVLAPGSRFEYSPDLNMEDANVVGLRRDYYMFQGPVMTYPETIAVAPGAVSVVDEIDLPSPQALIVRIQDSTTALCTNTSVLAPATLSDNLVRLPAGTVWCSITELHATIRFLVTPTPNAQYALNGNSFLKFNDIGQSYVSSSFENGQIVRHYIFSSQSQFTISASLEGPGQAMFRLHQFSPARPNVPTTGGESVIDHIATADMISYAPPILSVQSFFGDCMFDTTCLWPDLNDYYVNNVRDSGSNPDSVPVQYSLLTTYCSANDPTTGIAHPFSNDQIRKLYSFLYSLLVVQANLAFVNPVDVNKVARIQDANLQTYNTAPIMDL
jgi:hypothetical protein